MVERFKVQEGSQLGHCCIEATVVDTTRPILVLEQQQGFEAVCECARAVDAIIIAQALNKTEPSGAAA